MNCISYTYIVKFLFVVPSTPRSLEIISVDSSSVTLQWMPPETPNGIITHYSLQNGPTITTLSSNVLMFTVKGLSPDTMHVLQLRAHTRVGEGPPNNVIVTTCKLVIILLILLILFIAIRN